jgi:Cu/Zn superoxide dismutase
MRAGIFACLLAVFHHTVALQQAVVIINARGITGNITFIEIDDMNTRVIVDLQGLTGEQGWHVHQLPVDQIVPPDQQCLGAWVGPHYDPIGRRANPNYEDECNQNTPELCEFGDLAGRLGPLPSDGQLDAIDSTGEIDLQGTYSIVGRSVVIHEAGTNDNFECGTIRHQMELDGAEVTILQSIFVSPIAGRMYFKQVDGVRDVQVWGKLYYVDDSATTLDHNWHIHDRLPMEDYRVGMCASAGPHYDPTGANASSPGYNTSCTVQTPMMCEVGDLTGKLGTVNVPAQPAPYSTNAFFFTDFYLNLTGFQPVIGRSVVVHVPNRGAPRLGCAPLVEAENITLMGFRGNGGLPLANISQYSRYQDTRVSIGFLPSVGVPDDIGNDNPDLTIVTAALSPNGPCLLDGGSTSSSDSTYSPINPVDNVMTPDGFDLGDLSGAYPGKAISCNAFSAFDLPVFGALTTITARTLRYTVGAYRECGALLPPIEGENIVAARASFSGREIGGNVFFFQERSNNVVTGSTFIIVDIYYLQNNMVRTSTHNWHIHEFPAMAEQVCMGTIGGHYNPFSVSLAAGEDGINSDYSVDCSETYPLRCESGDMSGKHDQLEIAAGPDPNRPTYSYVDSNLELGGTYSILDRSVGLHRPVAEGGDLFDCATVTEFTISAATVVSSVFEMTSRVEFAIAVSDGIVSPNNVLILSQVSYGGCFMTTMRVLGESQGAANVYATMIAERVNAQFNTCTPEGEMLEEGVCDSAPLLLSLPLLLLALLSTSLFPSLF